MSVTDELNSHIDNMDDDVVVYVPRKKSASRIEYIDDEGVRVVADPAAEKTAAEQESVRTEPAQEATRRMAAVVTGVEPSEAPVPVARRERGKTTKTHSRVRRSHLKKINIPTGLLAAGMASLGILFLVLGMVLSGVDKGNGLPGAAERGFVDDSGFACTPLYNGEAVSVEADAAVCAVTPDKKNLIIQRNDGSIIRYDIAKKMTNEMCGGAKKQTGIIAVRTEGIIYEDTDGILHRFTFSDGADVAVCRPGSFSIAKNSLSILYSSEDRFFILRADDSEPAEAGGYSGTPRAAAVSDDGRCAVWTDWSNNAQNIYLFDSRGRSTLETLVGTTAATNAVFSENGKLLAVLNPDSEFVYLWNRGTVSRAKLGGLPVSGQVYTASGPLGQNGKEDVSGVYVHVSGNAGGSVYYIDLMGEREKLISKVRDFQLRGGNCCFTASDGNMYYASVSGANASERVRIASDVQSFMLSKDGQHVYYLKDVSAGLGTLYVYHIGDEEPEKITSDAYGAYVPCENSSSVIYYREPESTEAPDTRIGEMYLFTKGKGSEKIASDAVIGKVSSGSESGRIDAESFVYLKYLSSDSSGKVYSNCVYYDGKESTALLKDVYYDSDSPWKLK